MSVLLQQLKLHAQQESMVLEALKDVKTAKWVDSKTKREATNVWIAQKDTPRILLDLLHALSVLQGSMANQIGRAVMIAKWACIKMKREATNV